MIKIRNLQKSYGSFSVLKGLDMNVEKGDVYGFLGKNGCGKTTTMNILCNIFSKDGGDVIVGENGENVKIGYLPETPMLFNYMNAYEYLDYIAACADFKGDKKARIDELLELVALKDAAKRKIKGYSRGMNQRLGIAATILNYPDILVLDEPTSALDPEGRADVMNIIEKLSRTGVTIILCTHILSDVERVANKVGIVSGGRIVLEGKIDELMKRSAKTEAELVLSDSTPENIAAVKALSGKGEIEKIDFYEKTGVFVIRSKNIDGAIAELMTLLSEKKITPRRLEIVVDNLERIYLRAVNENV